MVLLALLAFLPGVTSDFFSDDHVYITGNESLRAPFLDSWKFLFTRTNVYEFLPVRDLSYRLDVELFGFRALGFHLHNLLLYALCCGAVWLCTRSILHLLSAGRENRITNAVGPVWICAAATSFFAAHPAHVESVVWISGRKELLSGLFGLLSLWQFTSALITDPPKLRRLLAAYVLFLLALLSKSAAMPLAVLAFLLAVARYSPTSFDRRGVLRALAVSAPLVLTASGGLGLSLLVGTQTGVRLEMFGVQPVHEHSAFELAVRILGYLTGVALLPIRLRLMYDVEQAGLPGVVAYVLAVGAIAAAILGVGSLWRGRALLGFGAIAFVVLCLPYLQLIPFETWSLASERFLFLPLFGLALAAAAGVALMRPRLRDAIALAVVVAGLGATFHQSRMWANPRDLLSKTARLSPEHFDAQMRFISAVLLPKGRYADAEVAASGVRGRVSREVLLRYVQAERSREAGDPETARGHAAWLANLVGRDGPPDILMLVASLHESNGDWFEAARHYYNALRRSKSRSNLQRAQTGLSRVRRPFAGRLEALRREIAARPEDLRPVADLASLEMELFLLDEAEASYRRILERFPDLSSARYNLGLTHARQNRPVQAAREIRAAIQGGLALAEAWNNLGVAYMDSGQPRAAAEAFTRAMELDHHHWYAA
ncbi:MAG: tetratricopeptide repeat protein, partial [Candidatus Thorarchaeota archaeon]